MAQERLLNLGFEHLPDVCDKVVWLDADLLFEDDGWLERPANCWNGFRWSNPSRSCSDTASPSIVGRRVGWRTEPSRVWPASTSVPGMGGADVVRVGLGRAAVAPSRA